MQILKFLRGTAFLVVFAFTFENTIGYGESAGLRPSSAITRPSSFLKARYLANTFSPERVRSELRSETYVSDTPLKTGGFELRTVKSTVNRPQSTALSPSTVDHGLSTRNPRAELRERAGIFLANGAVIQLLFHLYPEAMSEFFKSKVQPKNQTSGDISDSSGRRHESTRQSKVYSVSYDPVLRRWKNSTIQIGKEIIRPERLSNKELELWNQSLELLSKRERHFLDKSAQFLLIEDVDELFGFLNARHDTSLISILHSRLSVSVQYLFDIAFGADPLVIADGISFAVRTQTFSKQTTPSDSEAHDPASGKPVNLLSSKEIIIDDVGRRLFSDVRTGFSWHYRSIRKWLRKGAIPRQFRGVKRREIFFQLVRNHSRKILRLKSKTLAQQIAGFSEPSFDVRHKHRDETNAFIGKHILDFLDAAFDQKEERSVREAALQVMTVFFRRHVTRTRDFEFYCLYKIEKIILGAKDVGLRAAALRLLNAIITANQANQDDEITKSVLDVTQRMMGKLQEFILHPLDQSLAAEAIVTLTTCLFPVGIQYTLFRNHDVFQTARTTLSQVGKQIESYALKAGHVSPELERASLLGVLHLTRLFPSHIHIFFENYIFQSSEGQKPPLKRLSGRWIAKEDRERLSRTMPTLLNILSDDQALVRFITLLSIMRMIDNYYPTSAPHEPLIEFSEKNQLTVRLKELNITVVSESFRRAIIYTKDKSGKVQEAVEIKFPGEYPSSSFVSRLHYSLAKRLRKVLPQDQITVSEPLFYVALKGSIGLYLPEWGITEFSEKIPFGIAGFRYENGRRLDFILNDSSLREFWLRKLASGKDWFDTAVAKLASCLITYLSVVYRLGYAVRRGDHSDWHLGNFSIHPDGSVSSVADHGTYGYRGRNRISEELRVRDFNDLKTNLPHTIRSLFWSINFNVYAAIRNISPAVAAKFLRKMKKESSPARFIFAPGLMQLFWDAWLDYVSTTTGFKLVKDAPILILNEPLEGKAEDAQGLSADQRARILNRQLNRKSSTERLGGNEEDIKVLSISHLAFLQLKKKIRRDLMKDNMVYPPVELRFDSESQTWRVISENSEAKEAVETVLGALHLNGIKSQVVSIHFLNGFNYFVHEELDPDKRFPMPENEQNVDFDLANPSFYLDANLLARPIHLVDFLNETIMLRNQILKTFDEQTREKLDHDTADPHAKFLRAQTMLEAEHSMDDVMYAINHDIFGTADVFVRRRSVFLDEIRRFVRRTKITNSKDMNRIFKAMNRILNEPAHPKAPQIVDFAKTYFNYIQEFFLESRANDPAMAGFALDFITLLMQKHNLHFAGDDAYQIAAGVLDQFREPGSKLTLALIRFLKQAVIQTQADEQNYTPQAGSDVIRSYQFKLYALSWRMIRSILKKSINKTARDEVFALLKTLLPGNALPSFPLYQSTDDSSDFRVYVKQKMLPYLKKQVQTFKLLIDLEGINSFQQFLLAFYSLGGEYPEAKEMLEESVMNFVFDLDFDASSLANVDLKSFGDGETITGELMPTFARVLHDSDASSRFFHVIHFLSLFGSNDILDVHSVSVPIQRSFLGFDFGEFSILFLPRSEIGPAVVLRTKRGRDFFAKTVRFSINPSGPAVAVLSPLALIQPKKSTGSRRKDVVSPQRSELRSETYVSDTPLKTGGFELRTVSQESMVRSPQNLPLTVDHGQSARNPRVELRDNNQGEWSERKVTVTDPEGIHVRNGNRLIEKVQIYSSGGTEVQIVNPSNRALDLVSIMELTTAAIQQGTLLTVRVRGPQSGTALNEILEILSPHGTGKNTVDEDEITTWLNDVPPSQSPLINRGVIHERDIHHQKIAFGLVQAEEPDRVEMVFDKHLLAQNGLKLIYRGRRIPILTADEIPKSSKPAWMRNGTQVIPFIVRSYDWEVENVHEKLLRYAGQFDFVHTADDFQDQLREMYLMMHRMDLVNLLSWDANKVFPQFTLSPDSIHNILQEEQVFAHEHPLGTRPLVLFGIIPAEGEKAYFAASSMNNSNAHDYLFVRLNETGKSAIRGTFHNAFDNSPLILKIPMYRGSSQFFPNPNFPEHIVYINGVILAARILIKAGMPSTKQIIIDSPENKVISNPFFTAVGRMKRGTLGALAQHSLLDANGRPVPEQPRAELRTYAHLTAGRQYFIGGEKNTIIQNKLLQLTGLHQIILHENVYNPMNDSELSFHFAGQVKEIIKRTVETRKGNEKRQLRILVIGSGTGLDALTAYYQTVIVHGWAIELDAIDRSVPAAQNTAANFESLNQKYYRRNGIPRTVRIFNVADGAEFAPLGNHKYDLIFFNAPKVDSDLLHAPNADQYRRNIGVGMPESSFKSLMAGAADHLAPNGIAMIGTEKDARERGFFPRELDARMLYERQWPPVPLDSAWQPPLASRVIFLLNRSELRSDVWLDFLYPFTALFSLTAFGAVAWFYREKFWKPKKIQEPYSSEPEPISGIVAADSSSGQSSTILTSNQRHIQVTLDQNPDNYQMSFSERTVEGSIFTYIMTFQYDAQKSKLRVTTNLKSGSKAGQDLRIQNLGHEGHWYRFKFSHGMSEFIVKVSLFEKTATVWYQPKGLSQESTGFVDAEKLLERFRQLTSNAQAEDGKKLSQEDFLLDAVDKRIFLRKTAPITSRDFRQAEGRIHNMPILWAKRYSYKGETPALAYESFARQLAEDLTGILNAYLKFPGGQPVFSSDRLFQLFQAVYAFQSSNAQKVLHKNLSETGVRVALTNHTETFVLDGKTGGAIGIHLAAFLALAAANRDTAEIYLAAALMNHELFGHESGVEESLARYRLTHRPGGEDIAQNPAAVSAEAERALNFRDMELIAHLMPMYGIYRFNDSERSLESVLEPLRGLLRKQNAMFPSLIGDVVSHYRSLRGNMAALIRKLGQHQRALGFVMPDHSARLITVRDPSIQLPNARLVDDEEDETGGSHFGTITHYGLDMDMVTFGKIEPLGSKRLGEVSPHIGKLVVYFPVFKQFQEFRNEYPREAARRRVISFLTRFSFAGLPQTEMTVNDLPVQFEPDPNHLEADSDYLTFRGRKVYELFPELRDGPNPIEREDHITIGNFLKALGLEHSFDRSELRAVDVGDWPQKLYAAEKQELAAALRTGFQAAIQLSGQSSSRFLDLGAGEGTITKVLAPLFGEIIAVEQDPDRVRALKMKNIPGLTVVDGNFFSTEDPAVAGKAFDGILISHSLIFNTFHNRNLLIDSMLKKLAPYGRLALAMNSNNPAEGTAAHVRSRFMIKHTFQPRDRHASVEETVKSWGYEVTRQTVAVIHQTADISQVIKLMLAVLPKKDRGRMNRQLLTDYANQVLKKTNGQYELKAEFDILWVSHQLQTGVDHRSELRREIGEKANEPVTTIPSHVNLEHLLMSQAEPAINIALSEDERHFLREKLHLSGAAGNSAEVKSVEALVFMNNFVMRYAPLIPRIAKHLADNNPIVVIAPLNDLKDALIKANQKLPFDRQIIIVESPDEVRSAVEKQYPGARLHSVGLKSDSDYAASLLKRGVLDRYDTIERVTELFTVLNVSASLVREFQNLEQLIIAA